MSRKTVPLLEQMLGARSKVAVLRALFHSAAGYSGSALADLTGVGRLAVQNTLATLEGLGIVSVERGRVEHRYRLNTQHYLVVSALRPLFESEKRMRQALVRDLGGLLDGKVLAAGLFGSFARQDARPGSDIDLLVIVNNARERERAGNILADAQVSLGRKYGWPLQPAIFELSRLRRTRRKGSTLLDEAARDWHHVAGLRPAELRKTNLI